MNTLRRHLNDIRFSRKWRIKMGEVKLAIKCVNGKLSSQMNCEKATSGDISLVLSTLEIYKKQLLEDFIQISKGVRR